MNGHSSRPSRRERRPHRDSDRATSQGSDREEVAVRRSLKRKTARAAVNKIKLLEASDEDYQEDDDDDDEEKKPRRSSSRLRQTARVSKRTVVLKSSSESDGDSAGGIKCFENSHTGKCRQKKFLLLCSLSCVSPPSPHLLASQNTKKSGSESKDEDGNDSDASSFSQSKQNGRTKTSKQAAKIRKNGERCSYWL